MNSLEEYWVQRGEGYYEEFNARKVTVPFDLQEQRLLKALDGGHYPRILELGCGFGRITKLLVEHHAPTLINAIDISATLIARAKEIVKSTRVQYYCAPLRELSDFGEG